MSLEERGAYATIKDMILDRGGAIPDDIRFIAGNLGIDTRPAKRLRHRLIELQALYEDDGNLRCLRADHELADAGARITRAREAGISSASKRSATSNETNDLTATAAEPLSSDSDLDSDADQEREEGKKEPPVLRTGKFARPALVQPSPDIKALFSEFWQVYPKRSGGDAEKPAREKFEKLVLKEGFDPQKIIAGAAAYRSR